MAAFVIAFVWFIWLAPVKHIFSNAWNKQHSNQAYWEEVQKSIHRIGITSDDDVVAIGYWGDKKWAVWIIDHIKPGRDIGTDGNHLGESLAGITNHQLKPEAEIWLAWWKTNQNKTQVEWIREGFAERGIVLQQPLTTNNIIDLLKLAHLSTNSPAYTNTPDYLHPSLRENAFRWLRDSDFPPRVLFQMWNWDVKNIPQEDRDQTTAALFEYAEWYGEHWDDPGKLPFTPHSNFSFPEPFFMAAGCRWILYCVTAMLAISGFRLVRFNRSSKRS